MENPHSPVAACQNAPNAYLCPLPQLTHKPQANGPTLSMRNCVAFGLFTDDLINASKFSRLRSAVFKVSGKWPARARVTVPQNAQKMACSASDTGDGAGWDTLLRKYFHEIVFAKIFVSPSRDACSTLTGWPTGVFLLTPTDMALNQKNMFAGSAEHLAAEQMRLQHSSTVPGQYPLDL